MFRAENRRFLILAMLVITVFGITLGIIGVVVYIDAHPTALKDAKHTDPTILIGGITAFAGLSLNQLFSMIKQELDRQAADRSRETMHTKLDETLQKTSIVEKRTNGELDKKIADAAKGAVKEVLGVYVADLDQQMHLIKHAVANLSNRQKLVDAAASLPAEPGEPNA